MTEQARGAGAAEVVLITGGTDGLGRAAAILLAESGYRVFAAGRSAEKRAALQQLARERSLPLGVVETEKHILPDVPAAPSLAG